MNEMNSTRTIGRDPACDIVIDDDSVAAVHAQIELAEDGLVSVIDAGSAQGLYLKRSDRWIRVQKATLCSGDRIFFGDVEVPLSRLTAVFGPDSKVRLERKHVVLEHRVSAPGSPARRSETASVLQKPRRNPVTGKIEEDRETVYTETRQTGVDQQK